MEEHRKQLMEEEGDAFDDRFVERKETSDGTYPTVESNEVEIVRICILSFAYIYIIDIIYLILVLNIWL